MTVPSKNGLALYAELRSFHIVMFCGAIVVHALACLAPSFFSWSAILVAGVLFFLTGEIGINIGYHRLLSHASFRVPRWLRCVIAMLGNFALQGGPISWVGQHRTHHRESDQPLDPHTPLVGFWWAEFLWVFFDHPYFFDGPSKARFARDLTRDPFLRFLERWHVSLNLVLLALLAIAGGLLEGQRGAIAWVVYAGGVRIVAIWHLTFIVNAVNHKWGYRNYETADNSRNNIWISLIVCLGEGWHNNHHAQPRSAAHGHRPFEFDLAYNLICCLERLGLADKVHRPVSASVARDARDNS